MSEEYTKIELNAEINERVEAVVPVYVKGAGYRTEMMRIYIGNHNGGIRTECIYIEEMTPELRTLYKIGVAVSDKLINMVNKQTEKK